MSPARTWLNSLGDPISIQLSARPMTVHFQIRVADRARESSYRRLCALFSWSREYSAFVAMSVLLAADRCARYAPIAYSVDDQNAHHTADSAGFGRWLRVHEHILRCWVRSPVRARDVGVDGVAAAVASLRALTRPENLGLSFQVSSTARVPVL